MFKKRLSRHKYTIAVSVPVVALVASSLFFVRSPHDFYVVPSDNRYVEVGQQVTLDLMVRADEPINVISARMTLPSDVLRIERVSHEDSMIDLWTEEPYVADGSISFSGGSIHEGGFVGEGVVAHLHVVPLKAGSASVSFDEVHLLAHDGVGSELLTDIGPIVLMVRPAHYPSPDLNDDRQVNVLDFGLLSAQLFSTYTRDYDLNLDGRVSLADMGILLSNMVDESRLGGFAALFRSAA